MSCCTRKRQIHTHIHAKKQYIIIPEVLLPPFQKKKRITAVYYTSMQSSHQSSFLATGIARLIQAFFVHFTKNSGPKKLRFLRKNSGIFEKTQVFLSKNSDFRDFFIFLLNKLWKTQLKTKKTQVKRPKTQVSANFKFQKIPKSAQKKKPVLYHLLAASALTTASMYLWAYSDYAAMSNLDRGTTLIYPHYILCSTSSLKHYIVRRKTYTFS